MKLLWLASWYPSRVNFLSGDFIERHARAASLYNHIVVIHITKDPSVSKAVLEKRIYGENLVAFIWYYPPYRKLGKWFEKLVSNFQYNQLQRRAYRAYKKDFGKPDGIMVQVGMKAGFLAYRLNKLHHVPYILFERWTGLLKEAKPGFNDQPALQKRLWNLVLHNCAKLVTVSEYFGKVINEHYVQKEFSVIPNMVDEELFFPVIKQDHKQFRFIHVSNMDYQKNFEDILRALQQLYKKDIPVELVVYGPTNEGILELTKQLGLELIVFYKGEVVHEEIAKAMQSADALILYSRYETFGSVIIEANACGLPVIVSDHPVFREIVIEGLTGVFVKGEDPEELASKMNWLVKNFQQFDPALISASVRERYNPARIGQLFNKLFIEVFGKENKSRV